MYLQAHPAENVDASIEISLGASTEARKWSIRVTQVKLLAIWVIKIFSSSGPGPADVIIQVHHPPPPPPNHFLTSIERSISNFNWRWVHQLKWCSVQGPRYLKVTFKYELDSKEGPSCSSCRLNVVKAGHHLPTVSSTWQEFLEHSSHLTMMTPMMYLPIVKCMEFVSEERRIIVDILWFL